MPVYRYRCDGCGDEQLVPMSFREHEISKLDGGEMIHALSFRCGTYRQVLSFAFHRSMPEHFNSSLGTHISSSRQAKSALSRQSDEMAQRLGFTHSYEFIDPGDAASAGVNDKGMDATRARAVDEGRADLTSRTFT